MLLACYSTAPWLRTSVAAMPALVCPSAMTRRTSSSRGVSWYSGFPSLRRPRSWATADGEQQDDADRFGHGQAGQQPADQTEHARRHLVIA
jgi:hypothetical protein